MKTAVIISGGTIDYDFALAFLREQEYEICIGADRGLEFLKASQVMPTHIVGDFDSSAAEAKAYFEQFPELPIYTFQPEKDYTDTDIAMRLALELGAERIYLLGATGTRLDHVLANIRILHLALERGAEAFLLDPNNRIRLADRTLAISRREQFGKYVSLLALEGPVTHLTLTGFYYPLQDYTMTSTDAMAVSNEIAGEEGVIAFDGGILTVVESRD